jgi:hypothetical protein
MNMDAKLEATINHNDQEGVRVSLVCMLDRDGKYRWHVVNETTRELEDTEVSGRTLAEAREACRSAWGAECWGLVTSWVCTV